MQHHAPAFPVGQADRFCFVLISADVGPNVGAYANTLAGHQSEVRLIRPVAPPQIDLLLWLRAELFVGRPLRAEARQSCYESQFRTIH